MKDEGFEKLQQTVSPSQQVLPNTAARGKDEIRADIQRLQKAWDSLFENVNSAKVEQCRNKILNLLDHTCPIGQAGLLDLIHFHTSSEIVVFVNSGLNLVSHSGK